MLAAGVTVRDVARPRLAADQAGLPREWDFEAILRPLGTDRLEVAGACACCRPVKPRRLPRVRLSARLARGLLIFGEMDWPHYHAPELQPGGSWLTPPADYAALVGLTIEEERLESQRPAWATGALASRTAPVLAQAARSCCAPSPRDMHRCGQLLRGAGEGERPCGRPELPGAGRASAPAGRRPGRRRCVARHRRTRARSRPHRGIARAGRGPAPAQTRARASHPTRYPRHLLASACDRVFIDPAVV